MATLLDFPAELLDAIFEPLSFRDLATLVLVSKRLHEFVTPQLYSCIDLTVYCGQPRPIIHLTRSVLNNPKLANHIKSVRLLDGDWNIRGLHQGYGYFDPPKVSPPRPTDEDGMPQFVQFVQETDLSYASLWVEKLRTADLNAFVALLLSRLPGLKTFRIGYTAILPYIETPRRTQPKIPGENQFLGKLFQSAAFKTSTQPSAESSFPGPSHFHQLEEISFPGPISSDPGRNPDFSNPCDLAALLCLPSIRSIRGWCCNPDSLPFAWPIEPHPVHLTSLALSYIHVDFLAQILERTPALRTLRWTWKWIPATHPLNNDTIDLERFVEAVQPIRDVLENLTLGFENDEQYGALEPYRTRILGNLHGLEGFSNIKQFQAPLGFLLPDSDYRFADPNRRLEDGLPRNVEVVTFTDNYTSDMYAYDEWEELDLVHAWLVETASTRTPRLKEVVYRLDENKEELDEKRGCEDIKRAFEGTNVRYKIVKVSDEKPWEDA